jgi:hypothetical protein
MERLRWRLLASCALGAVLLIVLLLQLVLLVRRRPRPGVIQG